MDPYGRSKRKRFIGTALASQSSSWVEDSLKLPGFRFGSAPGTEQPYEIFGRQYRGIMIALHVMPVRHCCSHDPNKLGTKSEVMSRMVEAIHELNAAIVKNFFRQIALTIA
jgi:hypothetical protein